MNEQNFDALVLGGWYRQRHLHPAHNRWSPQTNHLGRELPEVWFGHFNSTQKISQLIVRLYV